MVDHGYGRIGRGGTHGKKELAPRVSWELANGEIPPFVLHRCDNPACVNPAHLFLGSQRTNMEDKVAKNRQARGERNAAAKTPGIGRDGNAI